MEERIEIGGKAYALRYTVNSLCAMEERCGCSLEQALSKDYTAARLLLWGGLIAKQPDLTLERAGEMLDRYLEDGGSIGGIVEIAAQALEAAGFLQDHA